MNFLARNDSSDTHKDAWALAKTAAVVGAENLCHLGIAQRNRPVPVKRSVSAAGPVLVRPGAGMIFGLRA